MLAFPFPQNAANNRPHISGPQFAARVHMILSYLTVT